MHMSCFRSIKKKKKKGFSPSQNCTAQCGRFGDGCDLLSGLRVCWRGMTDADYHSWRKPITLVITAPSGPFLLEWNALQNPLYIPLSAFHFRSMLIPPSLSVNRTVNGTLPSLALSPVWLQWASAPQSKEVVPFWESGELYSTLFCLLCRFKTRLFYFDRLNCSTRWVSLNDCRMNKFSCSALL